MLLQGNVEGKNNLIHERTIGKGPLAILACKSEHDQAVWIANVNKLGFAAWRREVHRETSMAAFQYLMGAEENLERDFLEWQDNWQ